MPCSDGQCADGEANRRYFDERENTRRAERDAYTRTHIETLESRLCTACTMLTSRGITLPCDLNWWWETHQEVDAIRLRRDEAKAKEQQLKARARAKLTDEERRALNLD